MNTDEPKKNRKKFTWFRFFPSEWIDVLTMTDCQAGKRFKQMLKSLITNSSQENTIEAVMINESIEYSEIKRKAAIRRWSENKNGNKATTPDASDAPCCTEALVSQRTGAAPLGNQAMNTAPVRKATASAKAVTLPKNKQEVIEFALDNGLDADDASEWAEVNLKERKGKDKDGKPIRNWKGALTNYCKAMERKRNNES